MKQSFGAGHFLSFIRFGGNWFEKPPLYFWSALATTKLFGFTEFALRLPAALCGILGVYFTWALAKKLSRNTWTAFFAGLMLIASGEFLYAAGQIRMDVPVAMCIIGSVYFFVIAWEKPRFYLLCGLILAFGVLFKSVIGFFALPIFLIFSLIYKKWDWLKQKWFWMGMLLSAAVIAPWHIYESIKFGSKFWDAYLGYHIFKRFAEPILGGNITNWHYLKYLGLLAGPLFLATVIAAFWLAYQLIKNPKQDRLKLPLASLLSAIFIFTVFATAHTKLFYYLEPMYPFLAILASACGITIYQSLKSATAKNIYVIFVCLLLFIGGLNAVWQKIFLRNGVSDDYTVSLQEKNIGQYMALHPEPQPVYALGWSWLETLDYYGNRPVSTTLSMDLDSHAQYLIVPTYLFQYYQFSQKFYGRATLAVDQNYLRLYQLKADSQ
jgi:4-amino-4-deoxy-L-arabinose transferase-like glycosyltransferase